MEYVSKRTILFLSLGALAVYLLSVVALATQHGTTGAVLGVFAGIGFLAAWVTGIIKTATIKRWGWLVVIILFGVLGTLAYGIFGNETPKA